MLYKDGSWDKLARQKLLMALAYLLIHRRNERMQEVIFGESGRYCGFDNANSVLPLRRKRRVLSWSGRGWFAGTAGGGCIAAAVWLAFTCAESLHLVQSAAWRTLV